MRHLTPDEAAEKVLGWQGRYRGQALLRVIFRKERTEKREIAIREQGPQRVRYKVTEPMLRLHFPELFSPQIDALTRELTHRIDALRATIGAEVDERVSPQVQMLRAAHERLTSDVTRLAQSTDEGFTRLERRIYKIEQDRSK